jgi:superfamily I DNA/RNA helicase
MIPDAKNFVCRKCRYAVNKQQFLKKPDKNTGISATPVQTPDSEGEIKIRWDNDQKKVIESSIKTRLLINAGPGTGKTEVACARVAWLLDSDSSETNPEDFLIISFTRAAIKEIRERISKSLKYPRDVYLVKIATMDSLAYKICELFDKEYLNTRPDYDNTIKHVSVLLKENKEVSGFFKNSVKHLIVDEAQDLVGIRADLIINIINNLDQDTGVTIFSDDAQAIYGSTWDRGTDKLGRSKKHYPNY